MVRQGGGAFEHAWRTCFLIFYRQIIPFIVERGVQDVFFFLGWGGDRK